MNDRKRQFAEILLRVLNKFLENQKRPRRYGLDELLYPAEIHMVMLIGENRGAGVTELATKAGITKGAVSQMANRLANKGLIKKSTDPENNSRVILELTNKGKVAFYSHERFHEETDREFFAYLDGLTPKKMATLERFLGLLEKGIDKRSET